MPIDDALEKLSTNEPEKVEAPKEQIIIKSSSAKEIIKEYIKDFTKYIDDLFKLNLSFNENELKDSLLDCIKFDKDLSLKINEEITRKELIDLLIANDEELKEILENTDVSKYIPEKFNMMDEYVYDSFPSFLKVKELLNYRKLKNLREQSTQIFIIPDLKFMSYFIEEDEKLRKYAELCKKKSSHLLFTDSSKETILYDPDIFTKENIKNFYEKTGIKEIKSMMDQINEISNNIYYTVYGSGNKTQSLKDLKESLYSRLKKYHPELTVEYVPEEASVEKSTGLYHVPYRAPPPTNNPITIQSPPQQFSIPKYEDPWREYKWTENR